jgi:NADP-dependent 3-hydroxy acid dehydrogenase YdfG
MKTINQVKKEIEKELKHEYRGLRQTSNTNKTLNNLLQLVDDIEEIAYNAGVIQGEKNASEALSDIM